MVLLGLDLLACQSQVFQTAAGQEGQQAEERGGGGGGVGPGRDCTLLEEVMLAEAEEDHEAKTSTKKKKKSDQAKAQRPKGEIGSASGVSVSLHSLQGADDDKKGKSEKKLEKKKQGDKDWRDTSHRESVGLLQHVLFLMCSYPSLRSQQQPETGKG